MKFSISYTNQEQKAIEVIKNLGGKNGDLNGSLAAKTNPGAFPTAIVEEKKSRKRWVIKVPKDKTELFIELFTGRLVQQLKQYLPEDARNDILCADIVKLHDGEGAWTYGLKQPLASFKELYYLTGSGTSYQSVLSSLAGVFSGISDAARGLLGYSVDSGPKMSIDRSAVLETLNGRAYYKAINDFESKAGLATCLLISLIVGDYSVHSGNLGVTNTREDEENGDLKTTQDSRIVRIDLGAAFRDYAKNSTTDIRKAGEYGGDNGVRLDAQTVKRATKNYIANYDVVKHLFEELRQAASSLEDNLISESKQQNPESLLEGCIFEALRGIPADLLAGEIRASLVKNNFSSKVFPGFNKVCTGDDPDNNRAFAKTLASMMLGRVRLAKRTGLDSTQEQIQHLSQESATLKKQLTFNTKCGEQEQKFLEAKIVENEAKLEELRKKLDQEKQKASKKNLRAAGALKEQAAEHKKSKEEWRAHDAKKDERVRRIAIQPVVTLPLLIGFPVGGGGTGAAIACSLSLFATHHAVIHLGATLTISACAAGCSIIGVGLVVGLLALLFYKLYRDNQKFKALSQISVLFTPSTEKGGATNVGIPTRDVIVDNAELAAKGGVSNQSLFKPSRHALASLVVERQALTPKSRT